MNRLQITLAVLLAFSAAGNAVLTKAYLGARDMRVAATGERDQARSAATMCSDAAGDLRTLADKLAQEGREARAAAARLARDHEARAQQILAASASTPGDDCKSARDRAHAWLQSRRSP